MLWGALANNAPDLDVFPGIFQSVPDALLSHRGFTHSILFALLGPPLLAWLFQRIFRKKDYGFRTWYLVFASGFFAHIILDSFTNYGTGWFEPFSHYRVSFNTIFVLDPFFTLSLLIAFFVLLVIKYNAPSRKYFLYGGLIISCCYLLFTFINKVTVNRIFKRSLAEKNVTVSAFITTPTPLNNLLWYDLAKTKDGFFIGYRSIFDKEPGMELTFVPQNDSLLGDLKSDKGVQKLIRFSQDYYCISQSDSTGINFHDLRFGQIGGWDDPQAAFVFSYYITRGAHNHATINQGRFEASTGAAFNSLIRRIKGGN